MKNLKAIRERLGLTQTQFGAVMDCSQGNVGFLERGEQQLLPDRAVRLIEFAETKGLRLTLDQVYDRAPLPEAEERRAA